MGGPTVFRPIHQRTEVAEKTITPKFRDTDEFREIHHPRFVYMRQKNLNTKDPLGRTTDLSSNFDNLLVTGYRQLREREDLKVCSHRNPPHFHALSAQEVQSVLTVRI